MQNTKLKLRYHFPLLNLILLVATFALAFTCLLGASTLWASFAFSALLAMLTIAPVVAFYSQDERRAFWLGLSVCGLSYTTVSSGPGFTAEVSPRLVTTRLLQWAYTYVIPENHQVIKAAPLEPFWIAGSTIRDVVKGLDTDTIEGGIVDVMVEDGEDVTLSVVNGVRVLGSSLGRNSPPGVTVGVSSSQLKLLNRSKAEGRKFSIRRHVVSQDWRNRLSSPVTPDDFIKVGHYCLAFACAGFGGFLGKFLYLKRDPRPPV